MNAVLCVLPCRRERRGEKVRERARKEQVCSATLHGREGQSCRSCPVTPGDRPGSRPAAQEGRVQRHREMGTRHPLCLPHLYQHIRTSGFLIMEGLFEAPCSSGTPWNNHCHLSFLFQLTADLGKYSVTKNSPLNSHRARHCFPVLLRKSLPQRQN